MRFRKRDRKIGEQVIMDGAIKCALVTGASSGIGKFYAEQLGKRGYKVILVSNQEKEVAESSASIPSSIGICKDLSLPNAAIELYDFCEQNGYEVEVLVNNAGVFYYQDIIDCTARQIDLMINLHVYTVTMLCRYFGEKMRERKHGYILNMSSISAYTPFCGISLYSATKSYLKTFSRGFRLEMRENGVHVMYVSPGAVATDLYKLPKNLQHIGVKIGVIYEPEKLVDNALRLLFKSHCVKYIPGAVNYLFRPVYSLLPYSFKMFIRKKTHRFRGI